MNIVQAAADLVWSAPINAYPDLKIALSEGGTSWIPYLLDRVDRSAKLRDDLRQLRGRDNSGLRSDHSGDDIDGPMRGVAA